MADCEKLQTCPFFNGRISTMPAVINLMKQSYCRGEKVQCARYQVSSSGKPVPADLLPNDVEQARRLIKGA